MPPKKAAAKSTRPSRARPLRGSTTSRARTAAHGKVAKVFAFKSDEKVVTTDIQDREGILPSIKTFLGKGR